MRACKIPPKKHRAYLNAVCPVTRREKYSSRNPSSCNHPWAPRDSSFLGPIRPETRDRDLSLFPTRQMLVKVFCSLPAIRCRGRQWANYLQLLNLRPFINYFTTAVGHPEDIYFPSSIYFTRVKHFVNYPRHTLGNHNQWLQDQLLTVLLYHAVALIIYETA